MSYLAKISESAGANDYLVYHALDVSKLKLILNSNSLRLPLSASNESEESLGVKKMFYMSFARTPASGYIADRSPGLRKVNETALIVFDRRLLESQRGVSFSPVQYFNVGDDGRSMGSAKEAEERLFSDKPLLTDILDAVREIRIMDDNYISDRQLYVLRQVYKTCLLKGIKIKLFSMDNYKGYLRGVENKADRDKVYQKIKSVKFIPDNSGSGYEARRSSIVRKKASFEVHDTFQMLSEFVYAQTLKELSKPARNKLYYLLRGWGDNTFQGYYKSEIHNLRGVVTSDIDRNKLNRMLKHMRVTTLKQFFDTLQSKWSAIYDREAS